MPDDLRVEVGALRKDATTWDDMAETMREAAATVDRMVDDPAMWSWVAMETGLAGPQGAYEALRGKAGQLLGQGAENFDSVSAALTAAANEYERTDDQTDEEIRRLWQLRDQ